MNACRLPAVDSIDETGDALPLANLAIAGGGGGTYRTLGRSHVRPRDAQSSELGCSARRAVFGSCALLVGTRG